MPYHTTPSTADAMLTSPIHARPVSLGGIIDPTRSLTLLSHPSVLAAISGHVPQKEYHDVLNQDLKKDMISGYAGHIPNHRQTYGKSFDKTVEDAKHMDDPEVTHNPNLDPTRPI